MKINVRFEGGESRYSANGVDYMLAIIPADALTEEQKERMDENDMRYQYSENYELYAEVEPLDYCEQAGISRAELERAYEAGDDAPAEVNEATYAALKSLILEQAQEIGIPADMLNFPWDSAYEVCIFVSIAEEADIDDETAEGLEALTESVTTFEGMTFREAREEAREYIADEVENLGFCAVMSRETEAVDVYDGCVDGQFIAEFYGFDAP